MEYAVFNQDSTKEILIEKSLYGAGDFKTGDKVMMEGDRVCSSYHSLHSFYIDLRWVTEITQEQFNDDGFKLSDLDETPPETTATALPTVPALSVVLELQLKNDEREAYEEQAKHLIESNLEAIKLAEEALVKAQSSLDNLKSEFEKTKAKINKGEKIGEESHLYFMKGRQCGTSMFFNCYQSNQETHMQNINTLTLTEGA